jgi:hypothetical protein
MTMAAKSDEKPKELQIRSPRPLPGPKAGEPPMDMERLREYRDNPSGENEKYAGQLIQRCGPLVLDGHQFRFGKLGEIEQVDVRLLGLDRQKEAEGIDKEPVAAA